MYQNRANHFSHHAEPAEAPESAKPDDSYSVKLAFMLKVIRHPDMTLAGVRAADTILSMRNRKMGYCFPSFDTVAECIGVVPSTARAAINLLVRLGFVRKEATRKGGRQGSNRLYAILPDADSSRRILSVSKPSSCRFDDAQVPISKSSSCRFDLPPGADLPAPNQVRDNQVRDNQLAAREGSSLDERPATVASRLDKVPLPSDLAFPAEAITAARLRGLDDADVAAAMASFRAVNANGLRTAPAWANGAKGWLGRQTPRPAGTTARIASESHRDPADADGVPFPGLASLVPLLRNDDDCHALAHAVPERILQPANVEFFAHYGRGGAGEEALSIDWPRVWRAWVQHAWDLDKTSRPKSKFAPPRPGI